MEPPAEYKELRSKCPVAPGRLFDGSKIWLISRHKELKEVLQDGRFSKVGGARGPQAVRGMITTGTYV